MSKTKKDMSKEIELSCLYNNREKIDSNSLTLKFTKSNAATEELKTSLLFDNSYVSLFFQTNLYFKIIF